MRNHPFIENRFHHTRNKSVVRSLLFFLFALCFFFESAESLAFSFKGTAYLNDGVTPISEKVDFTLSIYDPSRHCLLYQEQQANVNLIGKNGVFSLSVGALKQGDKKRVLGVDPNLPLEKVYATSGVVISPSGSCPGYTASQGDLRFLRVTIKRQSTQETITLSPDFPINPESRLLTSITPIDTGGTLTQTNLNTLTNGVDATSLHHHDSQYVRLSTQLSSYLGSAGQFYTSGSFSIGTPHATDSQLSLQAQSTTTVGEVIRGSTSQTSDLLRFQDASGSRLSSIHASGVLYLGSSQATSNEACTKSYVDQSISHLISTTSTLPDSSINWSSTATHDVPISKISCGNSNGIVKAGSNGATCDPLIASDIPELSWSKINTEKPTSLAGYGITDAAISAHHLEFTGIPTAPTAQSSSSTNQIATTAFVMNQLATTTPSTASSISRGDHRHPTDESRAPTSNPSFSGSASFPGLGGWTSAGKLGIGTTQPSAQVEVSGQMRTVATNAGTPASHALTVNWNHGNIQYTAGDCSGATTYTFENMLDGGTYSLVMTGTGGGICTFNDGMNVFKFPSSGNSVTSGAQAVFSFIRSGSTVFVSWEEY